MKIIKKVKVKQIITEKSKKALFERFNYHKMRLEQECQQLLFEQRKMNNKTAFSKQDIAQKFHEEIELRKDKIKAIDFKMEQLEILAIGSEILENEVEALVEVEEGTHWSKLMNDEAIILKDDIVVRIDKE
ncbi:hypothetical protein FHP05_01185 [Cerasibacillus terrae]|uniref:YlqD protein n=1 Tax=Cerasibacillus terrae TaxID=2498845 RepID=A0A5C8P229_9BACI|nr:YlqD family protein [Cerasibacillus terrae]TXL67659.1 hypothetical protein FHP05_01185 [Cerasibacillus terrae]